MNYLFYLWQLPQNLLGLALKLFYKKDINPIISIPDTDITVSKNFRGGISLGKYIFVSKYSNNIRSLKHEYGHVIQSKFLGWFYLLIIGLPSLIHAWLYNGSDYYSFYTEKWADKLSEKYLKMH